MIQKTDFRVEIIINDDASTDNTALIIAEYQKIYPQLFVVFYQSENQYSKGIKPHAHVMYPVAKGKYIAVCEGDDFWIDSQKLLKQVNYLEQNKGASMCFHRANVIAENGEIIKNKSVGSRQFKTKHSTKDLFRKAWFIPTASIVYRNKLFETFPSWYDAVKAGDLTLNFLLSKYGTLDYIDETLCTYRKHSGGVSTQINSIDRFADLIVIYKSINLEFGGVFEEEMHKAIHRKYAFLLKDSILTNDLNMDLFSQSLDISSILKFFLLKITNKVKRSLNPN